MPDTRNLYALKRETFCGTSHRSVTRKEEVRWLALLLHIPEVPDSDFGPETTYDILTKRCIVFLSPSRKVPR